MNPFVLAVFVVTFWAPIAYASSEDLANEIHTQLLKIELEVGPQQVASTIIHARPHLRTKEQEIIRLITLVFDSEEYRKIRVDYLVRAFTEGELAEQATMVRSPAFQRYQRKSLEMMQAVTVPFMKLVQEKYKELEATKKDE